MGLDLRLAVLVALLAGCAAPVAPAPLVSSPIYVYDCADPSVPCSTIVSGPGEASMEPVVAAHPIDPNVFAIVHAVGTTPPTLSVGGTATCRLTALFSTDGGGSWRTSTPAFPAWTGTRCTYSPDARFDRAGRLHVVAFDHLEPGGVAQNVYVRSEDLGATWSAPVVLFDGNHPGISIAPDGLIVVSSRSSSNDVTHAKFAWSRDDGVTWQRAAPDETLGCHLPTRAAFRDDRAIVACVRTEGSVWEIATYAIDPATASITALGSLAPPAPRSYLRPFLTELPDGRLALHYFDVAADPARVAASDYEDRAYVAWSADGARSWSRPVAVIDWLETGWSEFSAGAVADPLGGYHLLVTLARSPSPGLIDEALRHIVIDASGAKAHEAELAAWSHAKAGSPSAGLRAQGWIREPFAAMGWSEAGGVIAYPSLDDARGLRIVRVDARSAG